jgi:hypothetical protein
MIYFLTIFFWVGQKVTNIGFGIANNEVYMNYELIPKAIKNDMWCDGFTSIVTIMSWETYWFGKSTITLIIWSCN